MPLEKIEAHNFKSFRDLSVGLGPLTVLIGANASGKSNFVQLLRFLRDIANLGLDNAASIQGGVEFVANVKLGSQEPSRFALELRDDSAIGPFGATRSPNFIVHPQRIIYHLQIRPDSQRSEYSIDFDGFRILRDVYKPRKGGVPEFLGTAELAYPPGENDTSELRPRLPDGVPAEAVFSAYWVAFMNFSLPEVPGNKLALQRFSGQFDLLQPSAGLLRQLAVYDFHAKLPKETAQITGKIDLEEDGSNLVIVLKRILEDQEQRRIFSNLLQFVLPFAAEIEVQRWADRFLHFRLRETYLGDSFLPASLLSDGTINVIALIVALFFNDKPLIVIEEPEKNIHPYLIARVAELLKDASRNKQIIVTTHSPELVKHVALETLLFVSRDREGFSTLKRPAEMSDVRVFLDNEVGIADIFTHDLLGA